MIRILLVFLVLLPFPASATPAASASMEVSPTGLAYARLFVPGAKEVIVRTAWPTDWTQRADANQAVPYIGADLVLSGGAEGYPAGEVIEAFADLKARAQLVPSADHLFGVLAVPRKNLNEAVRIANAHLRAPSLDPAWLDRIREGFAQRARENGSRPVGRGYEALRWAILGDTPLRRFLSSDLIGDIADVSPRNIALWHRRTVLRNTASIVIAGDVTREEAGQAVDALFDGLPEGRAPEKASFAADFTPRRILLHDPDARDSQLTFVAPLPPTRQGHVYEDLFLLRALGAGDRGILFETVRTGLRSSYAFGAALDSFAADLRLLLFNGAVETAKLARTEQEIRAAYDKLRQEGPAEDIEALRSPFAINARANETVPAVLSMSALYSLLDGDGPEAALATVRKVEAVTVQSLEDRLHRAWPASRDFVVVAVSPDADALPGACVIRNPEQAAACR